MFRPYEEYDAIESALAAIFDEQPGLKSSSIAHEPNSAIGIMIGSRFEHFDYSEDFIEQVKLITAKLRIESKSHYRLIFDWYRQNNHRSISRSPDDEISFLRMKTEALEFIFCKLTGQDFSFDSKYSYRDDGVPSHLEPGDRVVITDGTMHLIGTAAYVIFVDEMRRCICRYFVNGRELICHVNIDDLRII